MLHCSTRQQSAVFRSCRVWEKFAYEKFNWKKEGRRAFATCPGCPGPVLFSLLAAIRGKEPNRRMCHMQPITSKRYYHKC